MQLYNLNDYNVKIEKNQIDLKNRNALKSNKYFFLYLIYDSQFFYVGASSFALCKSGAELKKIENRTLNKEKNNFFPF